MPCSKPVFTPLLTTALCSPHCTNDRTEAGGIESVGPKERSKSLGWDWSPGAPTPEPGAFTCCMALQTSPGCVPGALLSTLRGLATSQQPCEGGASIARKPGQSGGNTGLRTCTAAAVDPDGEVVSPKPHGEMGSRLLSRLQQTLSGSLFSGVVLT